MHWRQQVHRVSKAKACSPINHQFMSFAECEFNIQSDMVMPDALFLRKGNTEFLYPNRPNGIISMTQGEEFEIHCPGAGNFVQNIAGNVQSIVARCAHDQIISTQNGNTKALRDIKCSKDVDSVAKRVTGKKCNENRNDVIEIGFQTSKNWIRLIEICHDSAKSQTHWVHYIMNPLNEAHTVVRPRPLFKAGTFFPKIQNVDVSYTIPGSKKSLHQILGDQKRVDALLQSDKNRVTRGHMAAAGDFVFRIQQIATFHYLNCAPQWGSFNNFNWNFAEIIIRNIVRSVNESNTLIYTGTHGIMTRAQTELYVAGSAMQPRIPIPQLYYKVVVMPKKRKGIVFIGINDPQATEYQIHGVYRLCENVIDEVSHVDQYRKKIKIIANGYVYACHVRAFLAGLIESGKNTLPKDIPMNLDLIV